MHDEIETTEAVPPASEEATTERRRFLTRGALTAAAAAAGIVALSDSADAADGGNMLIGSANSGNGAASTTSLTNSRMAVTSPSGSPAVAGTNTGGGTGVYGEAGTSTSANVGVHGRTVIGGGTGVLGENIGSSGGYGVRGTSEYGIGVYGSGGTALIKGIGLQGHSDIGPSLHLDASSLTVPPAGSWTQGSFLQVAGHLWYCYKSGAGAAAGWVKLSGAPIIFANSYRAYDSRPGEVPLGVTKGPITNGVDRGGIDLKVNSGGLLPSGISAAVVTLTATGTDAAGFFGLHKNGTAWPGTSTINWGSVNTSVANTTIVAVDTLSRVAVRGAGSAHCIIDVIGFLP